LVLEQEPFSTGKRAEGLCRGIVYRYDCTWLSCRVRIERKEGRKESKRWFENKLCIFY
jgi:hypothetical protein